jgi:hypothetical protein
MPWFWPCSLAESLGVEFLFSGGADIPRGEGDKAGEQHLNDVIRFHRGSLVAHSRHGDRGV